jgi:lipoate-protein ligase A
MKASNWTILDTGIASAKKNMEIDAKLLEELDPFSNNPTLHLYDWITPSATYGHFIDPATLISEEMLGDSSFEFAKRPTGGGLIFHTTDWAFSVLVPASHPAYSVNILDNYAFVNNLVMQVISRFLGNQVHLSLLPSESASIGCHSQHFCMAKPTKYDVMLEGKKVGGGAQRRTKSGFLHQGSISLVPPDEAFLEKALLPHTHVREAMLKNTYALLPQASSQELRNARKLLSECFKAIVQ